MPGFSKHERGDTQQVRHIRHLSPFAKADVNLTCVVYGLGEARGQLDRIFHDLLYPPPQRCEVPNAGIGSVLPFSIKSAVSSKEFGPLWSASF